MTYRKKLIEVALPLDAINRESAREKSIRHGHPSTLHLWWARRPLATCRAVIFASLVDDPEQEGVPKKLLDAIDALPTPPQGAADAAGSLRRAKLFHLIEELVKWENTTNEALLDTAHKLIQAATGGNPPPLLDPFCGGGSIPLEGQRLGLEVYASDLNPVAVLITKAMVEIPPKFAGRPPVNPESRRGTGSTAAWKGASGLAADVRYYGRWMRDEAWKRIGHLYPKGPIGETIIAWLWARTVKCPNPVCGARMPLVRSFWLSTKKGKETWVEPIIDKRQKTIRFNVQTAKPRDPDVLARGTKVGRADFGCLLCGQAAGDEHIKAEGMAGRMGQQLIAVVAEGNRSRAYLSPDEVAVASLSKSELAKAQEMCEGQLAGSTPARLTGGTCYGYGLTTWGALFTPRQLVALTTFCDLVQKARELVLQHSSGDEEYVNAVATYLALAFDRLVNQLATLCCWHNSGEKLEGVYARQALPMVWDFAEGNPFRESTGNWLGAIVWIAKVVENLPKVRVRGHIQQLDAASAVNGAPGSIVVTDPPYYANIGYADLSDFFYVWLRRSIGSAYPELFSTLLTPKGPELVASPYRFGGDRRKAKEHFENGLGKAFVLIHQRAHTDYPVTLYYAFKQTEEENGNGQSGTLQLRASTGWETMLQGLLASGFQVTGTWPMRTEMGTRTVAANTNALASSIVIACRPRPVDAPIATRREFLSTLRRELPQQLKVLMSGRVAPVDLAQAAIGPGMAVFSRYSKVLEADGTSMTIRTALQEINYVVEDILAQQEGDLDVESQFCVNWYAEFGANWGEYGRAETLVTAKNLSVEGLQRRDLVEAARGRVRLKLRGNFQEGWDPGQQGRVSTWEACQRLVWTLMNNNLGEPEAGRLARRLGGLAEQARDLAFRLYGMADHKKWAEEALGYNALVASWPEIQKHAAAAAGETQARMV